MPRFSCDDQVRVRDDIHTGALMTMEDNPGKCYFSTRHQRFAGSIVTIDGLFYWNGKRCWCYRIKEDNGSGFWFDEMFECESCAVIDESRLMEVLF